MGFDWIGLTLCLCYPDNSCFWVPLTHESCSPPQTAEADGAHEFARMCVAINLSSALRNSAAKSSPHNFLGDRGLGDRRRPSWGHSRQIHDELYRSSDYVGSKPTVKRELASSSPQERRDADGASNPRGCPPPVGTVVNILIEDKAVPARVSASNLPLSKKGNNPVIDVYANEI